MLLLARTFPFFGNLPDTIVGAWGNISTTTSVAATNSAAAMTFAKSSPRQIRLNWDAFSVIDQLLEYKLNAGAFTTVTQNMILSGIVSGDTLQFRFTEAVSGYAPRTITVFDVLTTIAIDSFTVDSTP